MWLAGGYFDESEDDLPDSAYTVAGFVGSGLAAVCLDFEWGRLLQKYNLAYFKASELEYGFGEFRQYRDDPEDINKALSSGEKIKLREIKTAFIDAICNNPDMRGIACCMLLKDLAKLKSEELDLARRLPAPYLLCSEFMLIEAGRMMKETNLEEMRNQGLLRPIFDSHEVYEPMLRSEFETFQKYSPETARYILPPIFESEKNYLCLQAADCLAFEARKLLYNTYYDRPRPERIAMSRLKETSLDVIYKLDHAALRTIAADYSFAVNDFKPTINNRPTRAHKLR